MAMNIDKNKLKKNADILKKKFGKKSGIFIKKAIRFFKKNYIPVLVALSALLIGIVALVIALSGDSEEPDDTESVAQKWENALTEGISAFSEGHVNLDIGESYVAAYYEHVESAKVSEYVTTLENELGVSFSKEKFPYTAGYGDKIIAIHYNMTEMRLSVTVTEKSN